EQSDRVRTDEAVHVYDPRPAFRQARAGRAEFLYDAKAAPAEPVRAEILDANGAVIRTIESRGRAGPNRIVWDLRYDPPHQVAFRTTPPDNPHIWEEPRFNGKETRPVVHWGIEGAQVTGPIVTPGKYSVRIRINGQIFTRSLDVLKDPSIGASAADLTESTAMQIRIRDAMTAAADIVNSIEVMRKQIEDDLKANAGKLEAERALRDERCAAGPTHAVQTFRSARHGRPKGLHYCAIICATSAGRRPVSSHRSSDTGTRPAALKSSMNCFIVKRSPSCCFRSESSC